MKCVSHFALISFLALIVAGLTGCKATPANDAGFIENPELMSRSHSTPFHRTYWNKKYDPKAYTEILVAPVNMNYVAAQGFWEKANAANSDPAKVKQELAGLADYTRQSFISAAANDPNKRFKVVQAAGPKTLILELALVQIVPSKAVMNALGYVSWVPAVITAAGSAATDSQDTGKGVVAIEGRIRDGATGEVIGMFADRESPKSAIVDLKAVSWWAPAKAIIEEWSQQLIALANRPPGGVVTDSPSFELLVW